nr:NADH dehydrogenase subunit 6 [Micraspides sp.]
MLISIYIYLIMLSCFLLKFKHPLAMGLMLFVQTCLICVSIGATNSNMWFSYILFIIFLGSLLVLFIYICSLASNEMFKLSKKMILMIFFTILMIFLILKNLDFSIMFFLTSSSDSSTMLFNIFPKESAYSITTYLYSMSIMMFTILMIFYLLLTLLIVAKITYNFFGPLRLSN